MSLGQLRSTWENLGRVDPLWAVLSDPTRRHGQWDIAEFMATGHDQVDLIERLLADNGLRLGNKVLDFGCGVGRLTNALAERVDAAVGVDIADSMIQEATRLSRHPERTRFVSYDGMHLPFDDDEFDSAVSLIVLQHARPAVQLACLLELQRVVRVGGALVLQIPSRPTVTAPLDRAAMLASIQILDAPGELASATSATVRVAVTNVSELEWPADRMLKLGNHWFDGDAMVIQDDGRTDLPHRVAPGESVELELLVTAPSVAGRYRLELDLMQEFVAWWKDMGSQPVGVEVEVRGEAAVAEQPPQASAAPPVEHDALPSTMEMHGLHRELVLSLFGHCGSKVHASVPDNMAGPEWESFIYVVQRVS